MYISRFTSKSSSKWWKRFALILLLTFLAVSYSIWNISISRERGRLSTVSTYDDVSYLKWASKYYFDAKRGNFSGEIVEFLTDYTHSPMIVFLAILGFSLFGFGYIQVYYALAFAVWIYLAFVTLICRRSHGSPLVSVLIASLAIPFAGMTALEFRPDQLWAIFLTGSCVWFLTDSRVFASRSASVAFGILTGMAFLAKPSTFAMTFVVCGGTWFLAACIAIYARKEGFREVARGLALMTAAVVVSSGWYCIPHAEAIYNYFYSNSFGESKEIWVFKGTLTERMLYYLRGVPAQSNLGAAYFPLVLLYFGGAIRDIARSSVLEDRLRGGAFLWMLLCLYLVNGIFTLKSPYLGGAFYGFLIFGGLWNLSRLFSWFCNHDLDRSPDIRRKLQALLVIVVITFFLSAYRFPDVCRVDPSTAKERRMLNRAVVTDIRPQDKSRTVNLVLTQELPIIGGFIEMEFRKRGQPLVISNVSMHTEFTAFENAVEVADYVVVQDPDFPGATGYGIPSEKFLPRILEFLQNDPNWRLNKEYPVESGKKLYLYVRDRGGRTADL